LSSDRAYTIFYPFSSDGKKTTLCEDKTWSSVFDPMAPRPKSEAMVLAAKNPLLSHKIQQFRIAGRMLLEASESNSRFRIFAGDPAESAGEKEFMQIHIDRIFNTDFGKDYNFNPKAGIMNFFPQLLCNLDRNLNNWFDNPEVPGLADAAENAYKLAYVTLSISNLKNKRLFRSLTGVIRWIASEAPGLLWRIITSQNAPDSPAWIKDADWAGVYIAAMDEAANEVQLENVKITKKILREFWLSFIGLDPPEESMARWLGFAEDEIEDMQGM